MNLMLVGLAVLPVILLLIYINSKDKGDKEPIGLLVKAFVMGVISAFPAMLLESVLQIFDPGEGFWAAHSLYTGFVVAGTSEELCKLALLSIAIWKRPEFNEYFDGIVYAAFVALGFACFENLGYVLSQGSFEASVSTGFSRALLSVPAHFLFGVTMGYFFSLAKFDPAHRGRNLLKAFAIPMLLHGTFDSILFLQSAMNEGGLMISSGILMAAFIIFDVKMWKWGLKRIARMQELSQREDYDPADPFKGFKWQF